MIRKPTLNSLRRSRYFVFLCALIFLLLGGSLLDDSLVHSVSFLALHALVLITAVRVVGGRSRQWIISLTLAVPWFCLSVWGLSAGQSNA